MNEDAGSTLRYASNADLPSSISEKLSAGEQTTYREAYNMAWETYSRDHATSHGTKAETRAQFAHTEALKAIGKDVAEA